MSSSENLRQTQSELGDASAPRPSTPPSASGTVAAGSKLSQAIEAACKNLRRSFLPEDDDNLIKENLYTTWTHVKEAIQRAGDPNLKNRLKERSEFNAYVTPGSEGERELIKVVGSMARQGDWSDLFQHGTLISSV
jgi:hypothetical protein